MNVLNVFRYFRRRDKDVRDDPKPPVLQNPGLEDVLSSEDEVLHLQNTQRKHRIAVERSNRAIMINPSSDSEEDDELQRRLKRTKLNRKRRSKKRKVLREIRKKVDTPQLAQLSDEEANETRENEENEKEQEDEEEQVEVPQLERVHSDRPDLPDQSDYPPGQNLEAGDPLVEIITVLDSESGKERQQKKLERRERKRLRRERKKEKRKRKQERKLAKKQREQKENYIQVDNTVLESDDTLGSTLANSTPQTHNDTVGSLANTFTQIPQVQPNRDVITQITERVEKQRDNSIRRGQQSNDNTFNEIIPPKPKSTKVLSQSSDAASNEAETSHHSIYSTNRSYISKSAVRDIQFQFEEELTSHTEIIPSTSPTGANESKSLKEILEQRYAANTSATHDLPPSSPSAVSILSLSLSLSLSSSL